MSKRMIELCSVPACGEPARASCDVCDEPRCIEHGSGSSFASNGVGDTFQCDHDAGVCPGPRPQPKPVAQLPLGLHGRITGAPIMRSTYDHYAVVRDLCTACDRKIDPERLQAGKAICAECC